MKHHSPHHTPPSGSTPAGTATNPAVVVGVDTPRAFTALDWAVAEAAARGSPLRIVHALQPALWPTPVGAALPLWLALQEAGNGLLREAALRVREVAPGLEVSTHLVRGRTRQVLYDQAQGADLLVLGSRAEPDSRGSSARSAATHTAVRAPCAAVVVVPASGAVAGGSNTPAAGAHVVLGIDRSASSAQAIPFAFRAAQQRGIPLTVVHALPPDLPADIEDVSVVVGAPHDVPSPVGSEFRVILDALAPWRAAFPEVTVNVRLGREDPTQALISASGSAALTVVGSRGHGRVRAALLGSVSRTVLLHARGPVAVVRHDRNTDARTPAAAHGAAVRTAG